VTTLLAVASLATTALGTVAPWASASWNPYLGGSHFEIDESANLKVDGTSTSIDWNDVNAATNGAQPVTFKADKPSGKTDDAFGQGTSEGDAVPTVVAGSIPPQKSDLTSFGVYDGETGYVHLAWARVQEPNGNTNMDFEFNQSRTPSSNGITPVRTEGDLLIEFHIVSGGSDATLSKRTWDGTVWGDEDPLGGNAIGSINTAAILAADSTIGSLSARTFGEASIDLTQIFSTSTCRHFGSAYLKSRSSDSFSSEIKDFIAPTNVDLTNCRSLVVKKVDPSGALLPGAAFRLAKTVSGVTTYYALTPSATTAGIFCVDNLDLGTYTLQETTAPSGYTAAADSSVVISTSSSQASCTTRLTGTVTADVTVTDQPQPGTINLVKKDDSSPTALAIAGASFTVFNDVGTVGTYQPLVDTTVYAGPTQTASDGTLTFSNVPLGHYCVVETTTPAGYDTAPAQCFAIVVGTGTGDVHNLTFTDPRQHRIIVLVCHEGTNTLDPSSVALTGDASSPKTSLAPGSLTAAQQAALCGLGGATYGGLSGHTNRSLTVTPG
jgi:hypothetical protein